ncbi:endonuclease I family protein [Flavobacterium sp. HSC-61S13]|uniref:endonuclease I family protein n=1 Tax=Flavobacterium sp. HSC-61S13 TaxID=2910963 RepID=UPI0020A1F3AB|nr:endonuclease [Flavobacterium sp. HSC-61S13]MCP1996051.1 endonuclease I [Flavobacterium sp. HSC-61S13]
MNRILLLIIGGFLFYNTTVAQPADQLTYYQGVDFSLTGVAFKNQLIRKITATHTKQLSYKQVWNAIKICDLDPTDPSKVLLLYGWKNTNKGIQSRTRNKEDNGGAKGDWNREHTFAKSLGKPNLDITGPGADAHHIRASDVDWNAARGNLKFADGLGNSGKSGNGWYPGDEWKGDVARMMMYMYLRYNTRCLPNNVGYGSTKATPDGMIDLFLKWNAEDPVSEIEIQRNNYLANTKNAYAQGNRNPFIDNPYWATQIWGGAAAQDRWKNLSAACMSNNLCSKTNAAIKK